jgi:predicted ATPase with chaperone activity
LNGSIQAWRIENASMESFADAYSDLEGQSLESPTYKPRTLSEVGVRPAVLEDLALKTLYLHGPFSVYAMAEQMKLSFEVGTELFQRLRSQNYCQVTGMSHHVPLIAITSTGRSRATELLSQNQYVGPTPVSLESYVEQVRRQSVRGVATRPEDVERAFSHMVIDRQILRQLGTALNSGTSIFLYGPTGVGKSTMAETLSRVLAEGGCWIPYAVEVDGQIITVHDPLIHTSLDEEDVPQHDDRWVRCHRPAVLVGGELTAEMLDLQLNPITRFYVGPAQMKANNGVLIIDDFGRQRIRPDELLNRWVVPLDRRIDFLTLSGGRKIEVPFDMLVVFATNMNPAELVDAAFLRRIQTKVRVGSVTEDQFCEIFRRVAVAQGLEADEQIVRELIGLIRRSSNSELKPCYPRDLVNQICWSARYEGRKAELDRESLRDAVATYFLPDA